ncbi:unnamed protein product [Thlaspi arvense]|uniref:Uncharacterized protein n=1 Tax=Thlaspi arvense TaxID=13288 RepID=A0AAU9SB34_THLAR|nr:unnamed protein product [Thlaspi arvense]
MKIRESEMGRAPCCDKANVKRGPWSPEEDAKLKDYIENQGTGGNWISLPHKAGLKRCGKSCRLRWLNYLRPNIRHGDFTEEEDNIIFSLYASIGSRWSVIAAHLHDMGSLVNSPNSNKLIMNHQEYSQKQSTNKGIMLLSDVRSGSSTTSTVTRVKMEHDDHDHDHHEEEERSIEDYGMEEIKQLISSSCTSSSSNSLWFDENKGEDKFMSYY